MAGSYKDSVSSIKVMLSNGSYGDIPWNRDVSEYESTFVFPFDFISKTRAVGATAGPNFIESLTLYDDKGNWE